jgi:(S)-citramalyl-CoA lyase
MSEASTRLDGFAPVRLRSVLFVGGLALDALGTALVSAADAVCIDIEDAVPPDAKGRALRAVCLALAALPLDSARRVVVRINSLRTLQGIADMQALLTRSHAALGLVLPKVESADEVAWAAALADDARSSVRLLPIIETSSGLGHCTAIAAASPRLAALFFGGFDLSTALGCEMAWEPLLYARSRVVHAAAAAGLQVLDSPFADLADSTGLQASALRGRALGMTGKTAKDPRQVEIINAAFSPSEAELDHAMRAIAAFEQDPAGALVIDGKLVELPTIKRLQLLLRATKPR